LRQGSTSFCEQKEAKKLFYSGPRALARSTPMSQSKKSFLLLFFKKEVISYGLSFAF
jgi:hypothetical protein